MISKLARVEWPDGTFIDSIKVWQKEWIYITEPRDVASATTPEFKSDHHEADLVDQEEP